MNENKNTQVLILTPHDNQSQDSTSVNWSYPIKKKGKVLTKLSYDDLVVLDYLLSDDDKHIHEKDPRLLNSLSNNARTVFVLVDHNYRPKYHYIVKTRSGKRIELSGKEKDAIKANIKKSTREAQRKMIENINAELAVAKLRDIE